MTTIPRRRRFRASFVAVFAFALLASCESKSNDDGEPANTTEGERAEGAAAEPERAADEPADESEPTEADAAPEDEGLASDDEATPGEGPPSDDEAASGEGPPPNPEATDADAAPGVRYALVPRDVPIYAAPSDDADSAVDSEATRWRFREGDAYIWGWVGERDGWVELRSLSNDERPESACYDIASGLRHVAVSVWVKRDDLMSVTTERTTVELPNGTVTFAPGVGLRATDDGLQAQLDGLRAVVPERAIATLAPSYEPPATVPPGPSLDGYLKVGSRFDLGDGAFVENERSTSHDGVGDPVFANVAAAFDSNEVTGYRGCIGFTASSAADAVQDDMVAPKGALAALLGTISGGTIAAEAELVWPDGSPAGTTRQPAHIDTLLGEDGDDPRCVRIPLRYDDGGWVSEAHGLDLCAAAADIEVSEFRSAFGDFGEGGAGLGGGPGRDGGQGLGGLEGIGIAPPDGGDGDDKEKPIPEAPDVPVDR